MLGLQMTGNGGFLVALAVATGLHVGALGLLPLSDGGESAGGGGEELLTIALAGEAVAGLVDTWETRPEAPASVETMKPPSTEMPQAQAITPEQMVRTASIQPLAPANLSEAPTPVTRASDRSLAPSIDAQPALPSTSDAPPKAKTASLATPTASEYPSLDTSAPTMPDFAVTASLRPAPRAAPAVRTRASGQGRSATSGLGATDAPRASASRQAQASAQAAWAAAIQRKVARAQVYPRGARGDGRVRLAMTITSNGTLAGVRVVQSSGVPAFDKAALRAAQRAAPFPKAPDVLTDARFAFGQWVTFQR